MLSFSTMITLWEWLLEIMCCCLTSNLALNLLRGSNEAGLFIECHKSWLLLILFLDMKQNFVLIELHRKSLTWPALVHDEGIPWNTRKVSLPNIRRTAFDVIGYKYNHHDIPACYLGVYISFHYVSQIYFLNIPMLLI